MRRQRVAVSRARRKGQGWILVVVLAVSCGKNATPFDGSGPPPVQGAAPAMPMADPHVAAMMGGGSAVPGGPAPAWTVSGTVQLAPEFEGQVGGTDVLFVMARVPGRRMPVAVERVPAPAFPLAYTLRSGHGSGPAGGPPPVLEVVARVSRNGTAGPAQPGDLEGVFDGQASPGATGIDIVIGEQY